jgi:hypothetical protein
VDQTARERLVARVCSSSVRVRARGRLHVVRHPGRDALYAACEVYDEALLHARDGGLPSPDEQLAWMLDAGLWDADREAALARVPRDIDDFKVNLYKATFRSTVRDALRKTLATARARLAALSAQRHAYAHLTDEGAASAARARYVLGRSLHSATGRPLFEDDDEFWGGDSGLLDEVALALAADRPTDADFREACRTDPWRTVWNAAKQAGSLFGTPSCDWTDEQKALAAWSSLYDGAYQHPECPPDAVLEDDDLMDGWMLCQRRKRAGGGDAGPELGGKGGEIFVPADTADDARRVYDLNDEKARQGVRKRFAALDKKGALEEAAAERAAAGGA